MFAYEDKQVQKKAAKSVIQRNATTAAGLRTNAVNRYQYLLANDGHTIAVSNSKIAITPEINETVKGDIVAASGKTYAGAVPGGNQAGNHAEKKLIHHDPTLTEIGVSRTVCSGCKTAIKAKNPAVAHVSDPDGTYAVATW